MARLLQGGAAVNVTDKKGALPVDGVPADDAADLAPLLRVSVPGREALSNGVPGSLYPRPPRRSADERPDLYSAGHVRRGQPTTVRRERQGVYPVLELAAARLAQLLDQLAAGHVPQTHHRVAARRGQVLPGGMKGQVGRPVQVPRRQFAQLLATCRIDEKDLAVGAAHLAAAGERQHLAVRRIGRRGQVHALEQRSQVVQRLAGRRVPQAHAGVTAGVEDQRHPFRHGRLLAVRRQAPARTPSPSPASAAVPWRPAYPRQSPARRRRH